jgi:dephospho-CoA kinase
MGIIVAGLTGGIATGKSTVSAIFKRLGAYIIDADELAREVVKKGAPAWKGIKGLFGEEVFNPDGTINRVKLGDIVFGDESKRKRLEEIIHPEVFKEFERLKDAIAKEGREAIILFDVPLLIESGYYNKVDKVILVYAGEREQISRLTGRFPLSEGSCGEDALKRIRAQMPLEEKRMYADYIIDNSGPKEETEAQCRKIYEELRGLKK